MKISWSMGIGYSAENVEQVSRTVKHFIFSNAVAICSELWSHIKQETRLLNYGGRFLVISYWNHRTLLRAPLHIQNHRYRKWESGFRS